MKVAVCLFGQPRAWKIASQTLKEIYKEEEVDFYVHTWTEDDNLYFDRFNVTHSREKLEREIIEVYHPKDLIINDRSRVMEQECRDLPEFDGKTYTRGLCQMYSMSKSIEMCIDSEIGYNLVVACRLDTYMSPGGKLKIPESPFKDCNRVLWIPNCHEPYFSIGGETQISDILYIMTLPAAKIISEEFFNFAKLRYKYLVEKDKTIPLEAPYPDHLCPYVFLEGTLMPFLSFVCILPVCGGNLGMYEGYIRILYPNCTGLADYLYSTDLNKVNKVVHYLDTYLTFENKGISSEELKQKFLQYDNSC